ncbi:MAG: hypothetical protein AAF526_01230 [Pseudomonadota bacterium]
MADSSDWRRDAREARRMARLAVRRVRRDRSGDREQPPRNKGGEARACGPGAIAAAQARDLLAADAALRVIRDRGDPSVPEADAPVTVAQGLASEHAAPLSTEDDALDGVLSEQELAPAASSAVLDWGGEALAVQGVTARSSEHDDHPAVDSSEEGASAHDINRSVTVEKPTPRQESGQRGQVALPLGNPSIQPECNGKQVKTGDCETGPEESERARQSLVEARFSPPGIALDPSFAQLIAGAHLKPALNEPDTGDALCQLIDRALAPFQPQLRDHLVTMAQRYVDESGNDG